MVLTKYVLHRGKEKPVSLLPPKSNHIVEVSCPECGEIRQTALWVLTRNGHDYCQKCAARFNYGKTLTPGSKYGTWEVIRASGRHGRSICRCTNCGTVKDVYNGSLTSGVSKSCGCITRRGELHHNWRGGVSHERALDMGRKKYRTWRKGVINRDCVCMKCGGNEKLQAHHIKNYKSNPALRYSLENGITLCRDCHNDFHRIYGNVGNGKAQITEYTAK